MTLPLSVKRGLALLTFPLTILVLATCGGGGGGSNPDPDAVTITGMVDDGGNTSPISGATCRFVGIGGRTLDTDRCDGGGRYTLSAPAGVEGVVRCSPPGVPNLSLSTVVSTMGWEAGDTIASENVTPATTVTADIIQHENPSDREGRKAELLRAIVAKEDPNLEIVVAMATRLYRALLERQVNVGFGSSGDGGDGGGESDSDIGGTSGEAGDGADFSPLAGARCRFVVGKDPISAEAAYPSAMADLLADGVLNRPDLADLAGEVTAGLDLDADEIRLAFAHVFPQGMGAGLVATTDADGHYFLPVPANLPGFVVCTPEGRQGLSLATYVPGHGPGIVLEAQDVTPATTVFSHLIAPQLGGDLAAIKENFLADLAGLTVHLTGEHLPDGPLTGIRMGDDPLPADGEVGLVAFTVTALYNIFYKNAVDVDFAAVIAHLAENRRVDPDYLVSLGLPAEQARLVREAVDTTAAALGTRLSDALSTARIHVTVQGGEDGGDLVQGAVVGIPGLEAPMGCDGCGRSTDERGQLSLTLSGIPGEPATVLAVTVSSVAGFEPVEAAVAVAAFASVDLELSLRSAETFDLELTWGGNGIGRVTSSPAGIDCRMEGRNLYGDCSAPFVADSQVTLTAVPEEGHTFDGWGGACEGEGACTVSIRDAARVTAIFAQSCRTEEVELSPEAAGFDSDGGRDGVDVNAPTGCPWSAVVAADADWIVLDGAGTGNGPGRVAYSVQPFGGTGSGRTATITVAGKIHTVSQDPAPCTYSLSETGAAFDHSGGQGGLEVRSPAGCPWSASLPPDADWITLDATSGSGTGTLSYTVSPHEDTVASRTTAITVAGELYTISQAAAPTLVTVAALDAVATEPRFELDYGQFQITRTASGVGSLNSSLTVNIGLGGSATNGSDFRTIAGTIVIGRGQRAGIIELRPLDDRVYEVDEIARLTILPGSGYTPGSADSAEITILNASALYVDQGNLPSWGGRSADLHRYTRAQQTFRPGYNNIRRVEINIVALYQTQGDNLTLEIWDDNGSAHALLGATGKEIPEAFSGLVRFDDFEPPILVTPDTTLRLRVYGNTDNFGWKYSEQDNYPEGEGYISGREVPGRDYYFRTWGLE